MFYILTINGLTLIKFKFKPPVGCVHGAVVAYYLTPHNQNDSYQEQASRLISGTDTVVTWRSVEDQSEPCAHKKLEKQLKRVSLATHADGKVSISQLADLHLQHVYRKEAPCMSDGFGFCHLSTHSQLLRITKARSTNFEVNY